MNKQCRKCGSSNWQKIRNGNYLTISCGGCSNSFEVELPEAVKEGGKCRDCFGELITKEAKVKQRKYERKFTYSHYLECNNCKKKYWLDKHKVFNSKFSIIDLVISEKNKPNLKNTYGRKITKNRKDNWSQPWRHKTNVKHSIFPKGYWANEQGNNN